ncbi:hypothetical protein B0H66DRAFT_641019 [Apodospora peruviana]|uniref:Potassium channel domain-containing protein n=1 Tax=Apodospora peruviana TaxID=516989 RepID=A0AAE0I0A2_9PEZI|nr:hypothetical protein B0H66DRAFT_641019 [Apodospora peruviana]
MEDASGETIGEHVGHMEDEADQLPNEVQPDESHMDPSRWWFASSAFPMIAGTLGPVASAFSICALVRPWRQDFPPDSDISKAEFVGDPVWLTVINGIQLVIALVANLALLLNMTRRLRFAIAQPITIVGWYISSIALIALAATASGPLLIEPQAQYIWSQAFYYAIYSAILYFVVASLMVVTFAGAQAGHYEKDFMLTPSQRTLMLQTISFLMYLLVGALVFCNVEDWSYLDAVYWAAVTLFTVGFGDYYPTTSLGRALLFPYALIGVISLGLVIGSIRSLILERGKHRLDARTLEKKRRNIIRRMTNKGQDHILVPIRDNQAAPSLNSASGTGLTEFERREQEFKLMRHIQQAAAHRRRWYAMAISATTWCVLWLVGAKIFQECEVSYQGWTYFDGFYFAFVSLTTIGYGDITPISPAGKSFWVFWAFLALPTTTVLISNAGDTVVKSIRDATDQIATITILPGERGFKKDLKRFLRTLSFGKLFVEEEIGETPGGFMGDLPRNDYDNEGNDDEEEGDEDELEAEGVKTKAGEAKEAVGKRDEDNHGERVAANAAAENENDKRKAVPPPPSEKEEDINGNSTHRLVTFNDDARQPPDRNKKKSAQSPLRLRRTESNGSSSTTTKSPKDKDNDRTPSSQTLKISRAVSFPRQTMPELPKNKADYHVALIEEIGRVMQHLKSKPPRKYTFQEWAWYLSLVGEDEGDADRHRKAQHQQTGRFGKLKRRKTADGGEEKEYEDGDEVNEKGEKKQWSWVGSKSPLMGSQEEAEWILEKLTQRLRDELREHSKVGKEGKKETGSMDGE